jgi:hypothetical protein
MSAGARRHVSFGADFVILQRVFDLLSAPKIRRQLRLGIKIPWTEESDAYIHTLKPQDIDGLGEEFRESFQRSSVAESQVSDEERELNLWMLRCVLTISAVLGKRNQVGDRAALSVLFLKTIITPANLEALLRTTDVDIRTGAVRSQARAILRSLCLVPTIWSLKLRDGSYFTSRLLMMT